ncbi:MAG TPA: hypothetical protein VGV36_09670 [Solirubrobacteraceae bacterium]|nr:hypothetical protein [Solirubrobacteraceae bacterium]
MVVAVAGHAFPDPALALDAASEAVAKAFNEARADPSAGEHGELRAALEALENVVHRALTDARVPSAERLRHREPIPTTLTPQQQAGIASLYRLPLGEKPLADHFAAILERHAPPVTELRRIAGSGLVRRPPAPAGRATEQDSSP